ncbi:restriction endonuclease subunit S [Desulfobacter sp.]
MHVCHINNGQLQLKDILKVSPDVEEKYKRTRLKGGEVLLTLVGSTGQSFVAPKELNGWNVPRAIAVIRPKSEIGADWLNICLQSKPAQHFLDVRANTTVQKTLNLKDVRDIPIPIPPPPIKEQIESIAVSLQKKIKLNRQINQTLEEVAQAIFKSWFVDFGPVKAKIEAKANGQDPERAAMCAISGKTDAELDHLPPEQLAKLHATAALFPDELTDSELGSIPEGWTYSTLGEVIEIFDSKRVPLSKRQREERKGPYPYYGAASVMDYVDDYLFDGTYLLMAEDGTVMDGNGYPTIQYVWGKFWVNNHAHILKGAAGVSGENILFFLKNTVIAPYVTGAVQLKINQKNMKMIPFLKAPEDVHQSFGKAIQPLFEVIKQRTNESQVLTELRDVLLPKLLSGSLEIRG